ncbi:unnamed protein product [Didymodactylos carnosus]|uniref:Peptide hydrolase n=1 Tax=Didymodactylos carnosus TaxID=1234261 RepID=A0A8S2DZV9_9BILA|nr:unnamed protein product [Didymodactylos carnosus]CAF3844524.1 unnamed protein product [Didymodactylos carnosus]
MELNKNFTVSPSAPLAVIYPTAQDLAVPKSKKRSRHFLLLLFILTSIALSAATLGIIIKTKNNNVFATSMTNASVINISNGEVKTTTTTSYAKSLVDLVTTEQIMNYLKQLQIIANKADGTRATGTIGFNNTVDYIHNYLVQNTDLQVQRQYFNVASFTLEHNPIFVSYINDIKTNYTYETDFLHLVHSASANLITPVRVTNIPNFGCESSDWQKAYPYPADGSVTLVKRGICSFIDKSDLAVEHKAVALLLYNDGNIGSERFQPISGTLVEGTTIPVLFLSYEVGRKLTEAVVNISTNVSVQINMTVKDEPFQSIANLCADTPTGDKTKTIVVGSHSDGVLDGSGINDNGSGTSANLALAYNLDRLLKTRHYKNYPYRVRFCWWGAEEDGLLGSIDHVNKADNTTEIGERLQDYIVYLNFDMLGSPNFIFGVQDGETANQTTIPSRAVPGSVKLTQLFSNFFKENNLPWTKTEFDGLSDDASFLAVGIATGGLFSGADEIKFEAERDYYHEILGEEQSGGIANIAHDPCYHEQCDTVQNINTFAYTKMVKAAAYVLEYLGQLDDLQQWLYPPSQQVKNLTPPYNSNTRKHFLLKQFYKKDDI